MKQHKKTEEEPTRDHEISEVSPVRGSDNTGQDWLLLRNRLHAYVTFPTPIYRKHPFSPGSNERSTHVATADAELRIEGSSYRPRSAYTRTAVHRTSARLPLHDRLSDCVNQLPPFAPRIRSANSIGPLRTLHQGQLGDRRGPLRATADWRGTDSDLDRIAA